MHLSASRICSTQHDPCQDAHAPEGTGAAAYGRILGRLQRSAKRCCVVAPGAVGRAPCFSPCARHRASALQPNLSDTEKESMISVVCVQGVVSMDPNNVSCWTVLRPATALATPSQRSIIKKSVTHMHTWAGGTFPLGVRALPTYHTAFSSANVIQCQLQACAASNK